MTTPLRVLYLNAPAADGSGELRLLGVVLAGCLHVAEPGTPIYPLRGPAWMDMGPVDALNDSMTVSGLYSAFWAAVLSREGD
jgi:hypothetical protein